MRRLLVLVSSVVFVDAMLFGALAPLVPGYADDFELSKAGAGLLAGAFGAGALLGGVPGGIAALRLGPRRTVVGGLVLLAVASVAFALSGGPWSLGLSRLVQGFASTTTWAGALAWVTVATPRERRGQTIGTAFGAAVFGAILGPMFGAVAELVGIRGAFVAVAGIALALAAWARSHPATPPEPRSPGAVRRAFADPGFVGGLWLNTLPAFLFGVMVLLAPLALDADGFSPLAVGAVFLAAGLVEVVVNPLLGRYSDRVGRLVPVRIALGATIVVSAALAFSDEAAVLAALVCVAAIAYGGLYTPGMALTSDRAELAGLSQGLAFGLMNSAWAAGNLAGPAAGGLLAEHAGDPASYLAGAVLATVTLLAARRPGRRRLAQSTA